MTRSFEYRMSVDPIDENYVYYSNEPPFIHPTNNLFCLNNVILKMRGSDEYLLQVCIPRGQEGKLILERGKWFITYSRHLNAALRTP